MYAIIHETRDEYGMVILETEVGGARTFDDARDFALNWATQRTTLMVTPVTTGRVVLDGEPLFTWYIGAKTAQFRPLADTAY